MANKKTLHTSMTRREAGLGLAYLGLELLVLPPVLNQGNALLPAPLSPVVLNFIFFSINFICILWIFHSFLGKSLSAAGENLSLFLKGTVLGFLAYIAGNFAVTFLICHLHPGFSNINDGTITAMAKSGFLLTAVGTMFLVPLVEETLYRGLIFQGLYRQNRIAAYLISSLAFCAIHVMGYAGRYDPVILGLCFIQYLPAGLCLAWSYVRADNIFAPILIHTLINALGILSVR